MAHSRCNPRAVPVAAGVIAAALLALSACGPPASDDTARARPLQVFAAASLTDAFAEVGRAFRARTGVRVEVVLAGSQVLAAQIEQGAPADVYASADRRHVRRLREGDLVAAPVHFADNGMVIAVPAGNPAGIGSLADLARRGRLALCARQVPCGAYARRVLERAEALYGQGFAASVLARTVTRPLDVRRVVTALVLGEADAGLVYRTDVTARVRDRLRVIPLPEGTQVRASYWAAPVRPARAESRRFVDFLRRPAAQAALERHGFLPPRPDPPASLRPGGPGAGVRQAAARR